MKRECLYQTTRNVRSLSQVFEGRQSLVLLGMYMGVVGCGEGIVYLTSPGRPTDIGFELGKDCYPYSR